MSGENENKYFMVKDKYGEHYLCPLGLVREKGFITDNDLDHCVEKEVAERYSGNIKVRPT